MTKFLLWAVAIVLAVALMLAGLWATFASFQILTADNAVFGWKEALAALWFSMMLAGAGSWHKAR